MQKIILNLEKEGECFTFFGEPDPEAAHLEFENVLAPGAAGPEPHIHVLQKETFHVISGTMVARVGREERTLGAGEKIVVPPGLVHTFTNSSQTEPLVNRIVVEPALNFQWYITEAAKSAIRNGGSWKDIPLLEVGYLMHKSRRENRIGGMPYFLQDILFGALAVTAVLTGKSKMISGIQQ